MSYRKKLFSISILYLWYNYTWVLYPELPKRRENKLVCNGATQKTSKFILEHYTEKIRKNLIENLQVLFGLVSQNVFFAIVKYVILITLIVCDNKCLVF